MPKLFSAAVIAILLFSSCGSGDSTTGADSVQTHDSTAQTAAEQPEYKEVHGGMMLLLPDMKIPGWINVDSVPEYNLNVKHEEVAVLFPSGFGVPEEVDVYAFAKHDVDATIHAIWYKMQVQGSENKDIWMVLYDTNGPLAAHCAATKGVGYQSGRIDAVNSLREVFIDQSTENNVTAKVIAIENGKFVTKSESTSTMPAGTTSAFDQYFKQ